MLATSSGATWHDHNSQWCHIIHDGTNVQHGQTKAALLEDAMLWRLTEVPSPGGASCFMWCTKHCIRSKPAAEPVQMLATSSSMVLRSGVLASNGLTAVYAWRHQHQAQARA